MSYWKVPFSFDVFEDGCDIVITDSGSIDGGKATGRWIRGPPMDVRA